MQNRIINLPRMELFVFMLEELTNWVRDNDPDLETLHEAFKSYVSAQRDLDVRILDGSAAFGVIDGVTNVLFSDEPLTREQWEARVAQEKSAK